MLVAIDTSTEIASLALVRENVLVAEQTWRTARNHTVELLPALQTLLKLAKAESKDLTGVIVAKGPGSFNGLRVGISAAKGIAYSLGIPIVAVDSLEVEAYQFADTGLPICPIFSAGRQEIATALFQKSGDMWQQLKPDGITTVELLCGETKETTLFCGEYVGTIAKQLKSLLKEKAAIASQLTDIRRAGYLAELGTKKLVAGETDDAATLQALYLRRPPIGEKKQK
jgi:tRNA threonylcarbamoyl adenosine modification protein YeaZ